MVLNPICQFPAVPAFTPARASKRTAYQIVNMPQSDQWKQMYLEAGPSLRSTAIDISFYEFHLINYCSITRLVAAMSVIALRSRSQVSV